MFEHEVRWSASNRLLGALRALFSHIVAWTRSHRPAVLGLSLIIFGSFVVRYLAFARYPTAPGADYGNYLTNLHAFLGNDVTGDGLGYPPLFLLYLWSITSFLGELVGLQVSGPLLAALLAIPAYLLLRNYVLVPFALVGSAVLVFSESISEMIGWGGNPNVLGMIFGTLSMAFLSRWLMKESRRDLAVSAISFGLLAGSHQLSLAFFGLATAVAVALYAGMARTRRALYLCGIGLGANLLAVVAFAPFYLRVAEASSYLLPSQLIYLSVEDFTFIFSWMFREALVIWILLIGLAVLGYRRLRAERPAPVSVGLALLVTPFVLALTLMALHPVRPMYFVFLGIVPGAIAFVEHEWKAVARRRRHPEFRVNASTVAVAIVLAFAVVLVSSAHRRAVQAADWYDVVSPEVLDGLEWLRQHTASDAVVATSGPVRYGAEEPVGCTWGWWIEGYAQRKSLCTADTQALTWPAQVRRSVDANAAFAGVDSFETGLLQVGDLAPYGSRGNPLIAGEFGRGYEALLYFSDARVYVRWQPVSGGPLQTASPYYLPERNVSLDTGGKWIRIQYRATAAGVSIVRTVDVARSSPRVFVNYTFDVSGSLREVGISVVSTSNSRLNNYDAIAKRLNVDGVPGFRERVGGAVDLVDGVEALSRTASSTNPHIDMPEFQFLFAPSGSDFNAAFEVQVDVDSAAKVTQLIHYHASSVFSAHGVDFVFVDKARIREIEWFQNDVKGFRIAYQNFGVVIFEVNP